MTKDAIPDQVKPSGKIPEGYEELTEGLARAIYRKGEVFYNNAQVVNRDLSVLVLRYFVQQRRKELKEKKPSKIAPHRLKKDVPTFTVLEALSATGLRAIRYWKEVEGLEKVVANDLDAGAVDTIKLNVEHNGLDAEKEVVPNEGDAIAVMVGHRSPLKQFDVVDLDPYGSAAPLLDSAVQAVADGGLLCVTCTDLAVLCGNSPEICYGRYGGTPLKSSFMHEMAVRIVLASIQAAANRHGRAVEPLICTKIDFYVRLFVRVRSSKALAQKSPSSSAIVYHCGGCGSFAKQSLGRVKEKPHVKFHPALGPPVGSKCPVCASSMSLGGPIWTKPLSDKAATDYILEQVQKKAGDKHFKAKGRIDALVTVLAEEVPNAPLFMHLADMCRVLKCQSPPTASLRAAIESKGFSVSQSHTDPQAVKTDAPIELLWDIMRLWVKKIGRGGNGKRNRKQVENDKVMNNARRGTVADRIMATEPSMIEEKEVDFSVKRDRFVKRGTSSRNPRFLPNPEPNWGPKSRAGKRKRETNDNNHSEGQKEGSRENGANKSLHPQEKNKTESTNGERNGREQNSADANKLDQPKTATPLKPGSPEAASPPAKQPRIEAG